MEGEISTSIRFGTDPLSRNTDKDGLNDFVEVDFKSADPFDPLDD